MAIVQWAIQTVPYFDDPLPTSVCLIFEGVLDLLMFAWFLTNLVLSGMFMVPVDCEINLQPNWNNTPSVSLVPRQSTNTTITNATVPSLVGNTTLLASNSTANSTLASSAAQCSKPAYIALLFFLSSITFCWLLNLGLDYYDYMKGVYWDNEEDTETHRAESMANLRIFNKFPSRLDFSGSRNGGSAHSPMVRSRAASMAGSQAALNAGGLKKSPSISTVAPLAGQIPMTMSPTATALSPEAKKGTTSKLNNVVGPPTGSSLKRTDSTGSISSKQGGGFEGNRSRAGSMSSLLDKGGSSSSGKSGMAKGSASNLFSKTMKKKFNL
jgi:uncharacterized membrane protein YgcG